MTNLELQMMLDNLANAGFLEAILKIQEKEKEYEESDFFKTTRISLMTLFERYLKYVELKTDLVGDLIERLQHADLEGLKKQAMGIFSSLLDSEQISNMFEDASKEFDIKKIQEENKELSELIEKLRE